VDSAPITIFDGSNFFEVKGTLEVLLSRPFGFPKFFHQHLLLRMEDKKISERLFTKNILNTSRQN